MDKTNWEDLGNITVSREHDEQGRYNPKGECNTCSNELEVMHDGISRIFFCLHCEQAYNLSGQRLRGGWCADYWSASDCGESWDIDY